MIKIIKNIFSLVYLQNQVEAPLKAIEAVDKFDVKNKCSRWWRKKARQKLPNSALPGPCLK